MTKYFNKQEDTFFAFLSIMENYLSSDYYFHFTGLIVNTTVFKSLFQRYLENFINFVNENPQVIDVYSNMLIKWLVSLLQHDIPESISLYFWDNILFKGFDCIFPIILGIFKMNMDVLMSTDDFSCSLSSGNERKVARVFKQTRRE